MWGWTKLAAVASPRVPVMRKGQRSRSPAILQRAVPVAPLGNWRSASSHSSTPGVAGTLAAAGRDEAGWAAGPGGEDAVGVEGVAAEVHEGAAGQLERPAGVAVGGGGDDGGDLDPPQLPELA